MKTIKLYDSDCHLSEFEAEVISCEPDGNEYIIILDKTAFFPEGGGQKADTGIIDGIQVIDVQISDGIIYHRTLSPVSEKNTVKCSIERAERFRRMQNHSGEHIISGLAHSLYGCENVGFHLSDEVTIDFDKELTKEQIKNIEQLANEAVYRNIPITAEYPDSETLKKLNYRSKLDLTEDVRIVTVEGIDVCACCAPHVSRSGEIGIIKILSFMRHRGGVRLFVKCGIDALNDYNIKCSNLSEIGVTLCSKPNETAEVFEKFYNDNLEIKQKLVKLNRELSKLKAENISDTDGNIVLFEDGSDMNTLRKTVLDAASHAKGICAGFSGNDNDGYIYVITSQSKGVRSLAKDINIALNGKGGGSDEMIQGSVNASRADIEKFIGEV